MLTLIDARLSEALERASARVRYHECLEGSDFVCATLLFSTMFRLVVKNRISTRCWTNITVCVTSFGSSLVYSSKLYCIRQLYSRANAHTDTQQTVRSLPLGVTELLPLPTCADSPASPLPTSRAVSETTSSSSGPSSRLLRTKPQQPRKPPPLTRPKLGHPCRAHRLRNRVWIRSWSSGSPNWSLRKLLPKQRLRRARQQTWSKRETQVKMG